MTIVAANHQTLDELEAYLNRAGFDARAERDLGPPIRASAILVVFPDDFAFDRVVERMQSVRAKVLLVTREPLRFAPLARSGVAVLPKPAWAWSIAEAIRALANG